MNLPGTLRCGEHLLNAHSLNSIAEMATVHPITIPYQISRRGIFGEGFDDLLRRPFCGGMLRHIEMHQAPPLMRQNHEHKQHFQLHRGYCKEVDGDQLAQLGSSERFSMFGMAFSSASALNV